MQPLVSIVTPSFNQAAFLESTITSVLNQDYPNLEYLLVDGKSTDGSVEIIKKYADRIAWWVSEADQGQADAINKGLEHAKGEIIGWLNSDDIYLPGTLPTIARFFQDHPDVGLVFGDLLAIDENGEQINTLRYADYKMQDLMAFHIIGQPAVFFRKEVLEKTGYLDLSYHYLLDHQLWIRMAGITTIQHIPQVLAGARYHVGAKNVTAAEQFGEEAYRIVDWMRTYAKTSSILPGIEKKVLAGACLIDGRYLLDGGKGWAAFKAYGRSIFLHPATGFREFHRMLYALAAALGLVRVQNVVERRRKMNTIKAKLSGKK
ncbi:MAG: glycosyltransferase family 2 protein [Anaerolineaceae bacterium]